MALFLANDKVADWLDRYPVKGRVTDATYESDSTKCRGRSAERLLDGARLVEEERPRRRG